MPLSHRQTQVLSLRLLRVGIADTARVLGLHYATVLFYLRQIKQEGASAERLQADIIRDACTDESRVVAANRARLARQGGVALPAGLSERLREIQEATERA